ncbi:hypothetical protein PAN31108_01938 [Pandoraea anhela]|uniref:Uncharacterized protein n=1 Tax=Pandoraea anhela TaxID=2508295 RepID=A0A5E4UCQ4_9BURK|nr:hypothetical protein PAN31108_01938 [Pandoraea anhela]
MSSGISPMERRAVRPLNYGQSYDDVKVSQTTMETTHITSPPTPHSRS